MRHLVPSCQVEFLQLLIIGALSPAAQPSQAILGRRDLSGPFGERKFCTFQNTRFSLSGRLICAREWVGLLGHLVPSCKVEFLQLLHLGAQGPAAQPSSAQPSCAARRWAQVRNPGVQPNCLPTLLSSLTGELLNLLALAAITLCWTYKTVLSLTFWSALSPRAPAA